MGFLSRFRSGDDEPEEETCPKCRTPAPVGAETCPECGWDMREAYHPEAAPQTDPV
jgi:ssDNA-binding Zn-finger/Zn-ribbon topoisomerase 1